jgi:predicted RNase H-like HicB family nuclease
MINTRYMYWQDGGLWLGYLEELPEYRTQGETLEELQENLKHIYRELTAGQAPPARTVAELRVTGDNET